MKLKEQEQIQGSVNKGKHLLLFLSALAIIIVSLFIINQVHNHLRCLTQMYRPKVTLWSVSGKKSELYLQKDYLIRRIDGEYVPGDDTPELQLADWKPEGSPKNALRLDLPGEDGTRTYSFDQNTLELIDYPVYQVKKSQTTLFSKRCFSNGWFCDDLYLKNGNKFGKVDYAYDKNWSEIEEADLDHDSNNELIFSLSVGHGTAWAPRLLAAYRTDTLKEIPVKDQILRKENKSSLIVDHIHPTVSRKGVVLNIDGKITWISSEDVEGEIRPGAQIQLDTDIIDFYVRDGVLYGRSAIFLRNPDDAVGLFIGNAVVTYEYRNSYIVHKNIRYERNDYGTP